MPVRNAFTAFDFPPDDATIDTLRTDLAFALRQFIRNSGMGQAKVGEVLGLKQNVVSEIVRGNIEHLSVERLIKAMVRAKMPGFAEWGASSEDARASVGVRVSGAISTSVAVAPTIGSPYQQNWFGDMGRLSDQSWLRVKSTEQ
jgi:predicted XRE-type DNA-binding protein